MSYRFMRILVLFDLPVNTSAERKEYRKFRKMLIESGFIMQQESVYAKLALNGVSADNIIKMIKQNKPHSGLVQILKITEKQYSAMETIVGKRRNDVLDSSERLVVL